MCSQRLIITQFLYFSFFIGVELKCFGICVHRDGFDLQVEFPIFQDLPQWPTPLGTLLYAQVCPPYESLFLLEKIFSRVNWCSLQNIQFVRLPLVDRLTLLPVMAAGMVTNWIRILISNEPPFYWWNELVENNGEFIHPFWSLSFFLTKLIVERV